MISITIIFNENELNLPVTHLESNDPFHKNLILRICDAYEIYIDSEDYVNDLISNNHIIFAIAGRETLVWVPEKITRKQYTSLLEIKDYVTQFKSFRAAIKVSDDEVTFLKDNVMENIEDFYNYILDNCLDRSR